MSGQHATRDVYKPQGAQYNPVETPKEKLGVLKGETMGTTYSIVLGDKSGEPRLSSTLWEHWLQELQGAVDSELERVNAVFSTYRDESEVSKFNHNTHARVQDTRVRTLQDKGRLEKNMPTKAFRASGELSTLLISSEKLRVQSRGAFNISGGMVYRLWGFDRDKGVVTPPTENALKRALNIMNATRVSCPGTKSSGVKGHDDDAGRCRVVGPLEAEMNFSAIAKGYGVDAIALLLSSKGISNYMVEIGGEVRVSGHHPHGRAWRLGVNTPKSEAEMTSVYSSVELSSNQALATSGTYRNAFEHEGKNYSHIIDPRDGRPKGYGLVSVSVIAPSCAIADALATTLLVLGEKEGRTLMQKHYPSTEAYFIYSEEGRLRSSATLGFHATKVEESIESS